MGAGRPDGFGLEFRVAGLGRGAALITWGDRVDDLAISEYTSMPMEVGLQILGRFGGPGSDDESQFGFVEFAQVGAGKHAGIGDDDHVGEVVALLEGLDDRHDRQGFGLVAFKTADLQREPAPVDQQAHHDLRVHPAFLGVSDLAKRVFFVASVIVTPNSMVRMIVSATTDGGQAVTFDTGPLGGVGEACVGTRIVTHRGPASTHRHATFPQRSAGHRCTLVHEEPVKPN